MRGILLLLSALAWSSCTPPDEAVPAKLRTLEQLVVESPGIEFPTRTALQLKAWGLYSDASKVDLTSQVQWLSADSSVGRIGPSGIAQLDGSGLARFEGRFEGRLGAVLISVTTAELQSLSVISSDSGPLASGETRHFTARARYSDGTSLDVTDRTTWVADGIVGNTTDHAGTVVGSSQGHGVLRATYYSQQTSVAFDVVAPRFLGLEFQVAPVAVHPGDTHQWAVNTVYSDGSRRDVSSQSTWTSSDLDVATLVTGGAVGVIFARSTGRSTITVRWNDTVISRELLIDAHQVVGLGFETTGLQLALGRSTGLDLIAELDDGSRVVVSNSASWISSQPAVAAVSNVDGFRGAVTGQTMGAATIHAWYSGLEASYTILVTEPELVALGSTLTGGRLAVGQSADFIVGGTFTDGTTLNMSETVIVAHGSRVVAGTLPGRLQVIGAALGSGTVELTAGGLSHPLTFEVSDTLLTGLVIVEAPRRNDVIVGSVPLGPPRFRAMATYSDGAEFDVSELCHWWVDDASTATFSELPGTRGVYEPSGGGTTEIHVVLDGQVGTLDWDFPANP